LVAEQDWTALLQRVIDGDRMALIQVSRLVNGFLVRWNAYTFRDEWEDVVQEVVAAAALALRDGRLREPRAALGYLMSTARFKYVDRLRIQIGARIGERLPWEDVTGGELPLQEALGAEAREDLRRALGRVPDKRRLAVIAVCVEGRTYEEGAQVTGIPLGSFKRYLRDGLAQLREELANFLER
jgi:RNA polymerase sigma factor (sigma-70 family)